MILEAILTTLDERGAVNVSPMGPEVDDAMQRLVLKPFQTSRTFRNLVRHRQGVLHVTDDVELLAHAAVGQLAAPPMRAAEAVEGLVLSDACRVYEFRVESIDDSQPRARIEAVVVHQATLRDFFGFNRAKHAVLEAAILATRLHLLPTAGVLDELERLSTVVEKTAGPQELRAFEFLRRFVESSAAAEPDGAEPDGARGQVGEPASEPGGSQAGEHGDAERTDQAGDVGQ